MTIALSLVLLIASGAAFWGIATYARHHWPSGPQYVATWIVASIVIAAVWALAYLAYNLVASPTLYCGFQDAAPCSRSDYLEEQLGLWTPITFITLAPVVAVLAGILFFVRVALTTDTPILTTKQISSPPGKIQLALCAIIALSVSILPPSEGGPAIVKSVIAVFLAIGAWLLAGRAIAKEANASARANAWLGYSFASTLVCSIGDAIYSASQTAEICKGIAGDPNCRTTQIETAFQMLPFSVAFSAVLYLIPVLALVRAVTVARAQFAEGSLTTLSVRERRGGLAIFAAAIAAIVGISVYQRASEKPPVNGWGPLRFGMTPEEAVKAVPSVKWFDTSLEECRARTPKKGCQLDSIDDEGYLFEQGVPFTPTLQFNRKGELKEITLDAATKIDRREACIALFERMLDWLAKQNGPIKAVPEQSLAVLHEPWRHLRRKTRGGVIYDLAFDQTKHDFQASESTSVDSKGAWGHVMGFIDSKGSSQCEMSIVFEGPRRYTDVDYE